MRYNTLSDLLLLLFEKYTQTHKGDEKNGNGKSIWMDKKMASRNEIVNSNKIVYEHKCALVQQKLFQLKSWKRHAEQQFTWSKQ